MSRMQAVWRSTGQTLCLVTFLFGCVMSGHEAWATHATPCMSLSAAAPPALPSPRAACLATGAPAAACNNLSNTPPDRGPSPRAACIAALPPLPPFSVSGASFYEDDTTRLFTNDTGNLMVNGLNIANAISVTPSRSDFSARIVTPLHILPSCWWPNCVIVEIKTGNATGDRTITFTAPLGHQTATANFTVKRPRPVAGRASFGVVGTVPMRCYQGPVFINCGGGTWNETTCSCQ
jgi:hypothetical protein